MLIWCKLLWLHLRSDASRAKWLHIIGQQVLQYTGVFPECSTWKLLNSMNSIRATGICLFKKSFLNYIHITIASLWFLISLKFTAVSKFMKPVIPILYKFLFLLGVEKRKSKLLPQSRNTSTVPYLYTPALKQTHFIKWKPF